MIPAAPRAIAVAAAAALLLFSSGAGAASPPFLPLQGYLQDTAGNPISGDVSLRFTIYDAEVGGNTVWNETQTALVEDGLFAIYLGEETTIDLGIFLAHTHLWLGIQVESDPEMGRVYLGSTPYTAYAEYCGNIPAHGHDLSEIAGSDALAAGPQVCSGSDKVVGLDLSGDLVCAADNNTTYLAGTGLTLSGNTFSVTSSTVQLRVSGTCASGSAIRSIAENGTVTCEGFVSSTGSETISGSLSVTGGVSASTFTAPDASVRQSGELVFRGMMPVWESEDRIITSSTAMERVTGTGICLTCYTLVPQLPGTTRRVRFGILYTDSQDSCGTASSWALTKHDTPATTYATWTVPETWSGSGLWHSYATPFFNASVLAHCGSSWADTCAVYAKLADTCPGRELHVRSIYLEYYDQLP
jgi:hypothetical protein